MKSIPVNAVINLIGTILISAFGVLVFENNKLLMAYKIVFFISLGICFLVLYYRKPLLVKINNFRNLDKVKQLQEQIVNQRNDIFRQLGHVESLVAQFKTNIDLLLSDVEKLEQKGGDLKSVREDMLIKIENIKKSIDEFGNCNRFSKRLIKI